MLQSAAVSPPSCHSNGPPPEIEEGAGYLGLLFKA